jgi:hypothetical protein
MGAQYCEPPETFMFQSKLSRIGLLIALLGFSILGASLYTWVHASPYNRLYYTHDAYTWVRTDSSDAPAVETDEVWEASAACLKPYFVSAAEKARATLKTHNDSIPDEVRKWNNRPSRPSLPPPSDNDRGERQSLELKEIIRKGEEDRYWFSLLSKYRDRFSTQFDLEENAKRWERRSSSVEDFRTTRDEALRRTSFRASDAVERAAIIMLGLSDFPEDQAKAIRTACLKIIPMKRIVTERTYHTNIWRWPADHAVPFWLGIALLFVGIGLSPAERWIRAGR